MHDFRMEQQPVQPATLVLHRGHRRVDGRGHDLEPGGAAATKSPWLAQMRNDLATSVNNGHESPVTSTTA